jgi:xanthine dehydrogenase YagS FAD-binding subunit
MHNFQYASSTGVHDAIGALASNPEARLVAGGTTLVDLMKLDVETPNQLIDINRLPLGDITETAAGGVRIGAMARNSAVAYHSLIRDRYPLVSEALLSGASGQLRNMATVGGNLMQRTRCAYFRDTRWACNKRTPGSGCSAQDGYHRTHAIFGVSDACFATNPSDMSVALVALEAIVHTESPTGRRSIPIADFHLPPGDTPHIETVLDHDELITAVELPKPAALWRSRYLKVRDRASYEFALVSVAALLDVSGGRIGGARIAFGGVGTKPWRAPRVEQILIGAEANHKVFRAAAERAIEGAAPRRHNRFKVELLKRTLIRTLEEITGAKI